ncbi:MAG: acetyl-CoA carboxylase biotin carboxyl carrier protein subunit [Alphaproteobacteria bacterium]
MARVKVISEIPGNVFRIEVAVGDRVDEDDPIVILESMKMEIPVGAPIGGKVVEILVEPGEAIAEGQQVATLDR